MVFASLVIGNPQWIIPAVLLLIAAVVLLARSYRGTALRGPWLALACGLKLLGLAILAFCLLEPLWSGARARPGANQFLLLADNSQSLQVRDPGQGHTRGEALAQTLAETKAPWLVRLNQDFDVRQYVFDERLRRTRDFAELKFEGTSSSLLSSLRTLRDRYQGRPLAGILVFTDGQATDWPAEKLDATGLPPIYPVVLGQSGSPKDVALTQVQVSQTAFEDAPVSVQAEVSAAGYAVGTKITGQLLDEAGKVIVTAEETVSATDRPLAFRFQLRPAAVGVLAYRLRVCTTQDLGIVEDPKKFPEATAANNFRWLTVAREREPQRVLYVSGRPNWEFKFLRRALTEDPQVQLVGMIRVAQREPKFSWRGRPGDAQNPLFRGFDKIDEGTERYDQPVLIRLNTQDENELREGFPKTPEGLYGYEALILDDLEAEFFTRDQLLLIERFVSERGGGLLMLGGLESFQRGNYQKTALANVLPVYLDQAIPSQPEPGYRLNLTRDGWLQPWVRLRSTEDAERTRLADMPAFQSVHLSRGIKPGATVLASMSDGLGQSAPALVAQRYGHGRGAALMIGDLWRWGLRQDPDDRDLEKSWRQLLRWLVSDVPQPVQVEPVPVPDQPSGPVRLQVRVRNPQFQPLDNATVQVLVKIPGGESLSLTAEPSASEPGLYEADYVPRAPGVFRAEAVVTNAEGKAAGRAEAGWAADPAALEFRDLRPQRDQLEELARQTGGEVIERDDLRSFAEGLPSRRAQLTDQTLYPLWHHPSVFLVALLCLAAEWGLRRWNGLP